MARLSWNNIFWLFMVLPVVFAQDYYKILGIDRDATDKEIKSAYRNLSKKFHPDKNPGSEEAHNKFIEIGEAYEVLIDSEKRRVFDQFGADAVKNGQQGGNGQGGFHDPFDMFQQMFNGGAGGNPFGGARQRQRGPNVLAHDEISLKDFYHGIKFERDLMLNDHCEHCHGSGSEDGKTVQCPDCQGRGVIVQLIQMGIMTQQIQQVCGRCQGKGEIIKNFCKKCHGEKVAKVSKHFVVDIPKGARRNYATSFQGEAEKSPDYDAGDLIFELGEHGRENMGYRRRGEHLYRTEVLSLKEAIKGGWEREIEFFDPSKKLIIKRDNDKIVYSGEVERIPGFGMAKEGGKRGYGDLFIDYVVLMPGELKGSPILDEL